MESPNFFCLSLKQFDTHIKSNLKQLQLEKDFSDVTIACEDRQIEAHKVIIAGASVVFRNLLKQSLHPHPIIFLRGVKFSDLSRMLDFMYQGEIKIEQTELEDFLTIAQEFKIKGLSEETVEDFRLFDSFVKDGVKRKRPRLLTPKQDPDSEVADIKIEIDDHGPVMSESLISHREQPVVFSPEQNLTDDIEDIKIEIDGDEPVTQEIEASAEYSDEEDINEEGKVPLQANVYFDVDGAKHGNAEHFADRLIVKRQLSFVSDDVDAKKVPIFSCEHCDYKVTTKKSLNIHVKTRHEGLRYPCEQCDLKFTSKSGVSRHIMSVHMKIRFPCEYCDYSATRLEQVKRHVKCAHENYQVKFGE